MWFKCLKQKRIAAPWFSETDKEKQDYIHNYIHVNYYMFIRLAVCACNRLYSNKHMVKMPMIAYTGSSTCMCWNHYTEINVWIWMKLLRVKGQWGQSKDSARKWHSKVLLENEGEGGFMVVIYCSAVKRIILTDTAVK